MSSTTSSVHDGNRQRSTRGSASNVAIADVESLIALHKSHISELVTVLDEVLYIVPKLMVIPKCADIVSAFRLQNSYVEQEYVCPIPFCRLKYSGKLQILPLWAQFTSVV